MTLPILSAQQPIVGSGGRPTPPFLQFMSKAREAQSKTDATQDALIAALAEAVAAIEAANAVAIAATEAAAVATAAAELANTAIVGLDDRLLALETP